MTTAVAINTIMNGDEVNNPAKLVDRAEGLPMVDSADRTARTTTDITKIIPIRLEIPSK
jgi:hypothetical protein